MKRIALSFCCLLLALIAVGQGKPIPRDASYYKAKGFQVFPEFGFAVKCDCLLEDISDQMKGNNDLAYGCYQNRGSKDNIVMTQIVAKRAPSSFLNASAAKKHEAENKLFSMMGGEKVVFLGQNAVVVNSTSNGNAGRAISFIRNGATYSFMMFTNNGLDSRFNYLTNNIKFF